MQWPCSFCTPKGQLQLKSDWSLLHMLCESSLCFCASCFFNHPFIVPFNQMNIAALPFKDQLLVRTVKQPRQWIICTIMDLFLQTAQYWEIGIKLINKLYFQIRMMLSLMSHD